MQLQHLRVVCATLSAPLMSNGAAARKLRQSSERRTFPSIRECSSECSPITGDRTIRQSYKSRFLSLFLSRKEVNAIFAAPPSSNEDKNRYNFRRVSISQKCALRQLCDGFITIRRGDNSLWL